MHLPYMEYYSAFKSNETLTEATTCMSRKDFKRRETEILKQKIHKDGEQQGRRWGGKIGHIEWKFSFSEMMKKVLEVDVVMIPQ